MSRSLLVAILGCALIASQAVIADDSDASIFMEYLSRKLLQGGGNGTSGNGTAGNDTTLSDAIDVWNSVSFQVNGSTVDTSQISGLTVFAPTNRAFDIALSPYGITNNLTERIASDPTLQQYATAVFANHLVPGLYKTQNFTDGETVIQTLLGTSLTVIKTGSNTTGASVNVTVPNSNITAHITKANIEFQGNIVHVIDELLIPVLNGTSNGTGNGTTA